MGNRWGAAGPPQEAYGRVTDRGVYDGLHDVARRLLDRLESRYEVSRETAVGADPAGGTAEVVRLVPTEPRCSPFAVTFTAFPGLVVRTSRATDSPVPTCGCDACDEGVDDCTEQLERLVAAVVAGTLGERLVRREGWWYEHWFETPDGQWAGSQLVDGARLNALRAELPEGERTWTAWIRRT